jgi:hypothetical protein
VCIGNLITICLLGEVSTDAGTFPILRGNCVLKKFLWSKGWKSVFPIAPEISKGGKDFECEST